MNEECDSLPEPNRRLCRGDIDLESFRRWMKTGVPPVEFLPVPIQSKDVASRLIEDLTDCIHRGEETGAELSGLPCNCDKRIFACEIAGPAGCTKSREIIGGILPSGRTIRRKMIGIGDPEIPRQCRLCPDRQPETGSPSS